ncbi:MAG: hypothetical protein LUD72_00950 [Bacteroidales bacterium]|nr:hypothetical protein [Bacteroidales bacterium]
MATLSIREQIQGVLAKESVGKRLSSRRVYDRGGKDSHIFSFLVKETTFVGYDWVSFYGEEEYDYCHLLLCDAIRLIGDGVVVSRISSTNGNHCNKITRLTENEKTENSNQEQTKQ